MKNIFLAIILNGCFILNFAQVTSERNVAPLSRLGCFTKNFTSVFSFGVNPSSIALLENFQVGVCMERPFMLPELTRYEMCLAAPTKRGNFGLHIMQEGYDLYHQTQAGIAFAKHLERLELGIKFNYQFTAIPAYIGMQAIIADIGTIWHMTEELHLTFDFHKRNFFGNSGSLREQTSFYSSTGLGYEVSELVFVALCLNKEEQSPANINVGIHYQFAKQFFASAGILTRQPQVLISAGWHWNSLRIDVTSAYHFQLGWSPGFLMIYQPSKRDRSK